MPSREFFEGGETRVAGREYLVAAPVSEGNLKAPTRHPIDWQNPDFFDEASLHKEMERVFDVCHGCRRCVSLCNCFPDAV